MRFRHQIEGLMLVVIAATLVAVFWPIEVTAGILVATYAAVSIAVEVLR